MLGFHGVFIDSPTIALGLKSNVAGSLQRMVVL